MASILLLCFTFFEIPIPHMIYLTIKYTVINFLFVAYFKEFPKLKSGVFWIALYGSVVSLSTLINGLKLSSLVSSVFFVLQIADIFIIVHRFKRCGKLDKAIRIFFNTLLTYALINDMLLPILKYDFNNPQTRYFIGSKFAISYLHSFLFILWMYRVDSCRRMGKKLTGARAVQIILGAGALFIPLVVKCSTGVVLAVCVILLSILSKRIWKWLSSWKIMVLILVGLNVLVFGSAQIFSSDWAVFIITQVFHKTAHLTGRLTIYQNLFAIIKGSPWIGYGHFSSIVDDLLGQGLGTLNAQNGIMKIWIDAGIIGVIAYSGIFHFAVRRMKDISEEARPFIIYMYGLIVISTVEICLTNFFAFLTMAFIYVIGQDNNRLKKQFNGKRNLKIKSGYKNDVVTFNRL